MHHIHMHRYGDHREVTMHLSMPDTYSLIQAHELSSQIEIKLRSETGIEPTIHFEPARDFEKARTGTSFRFNLKK
jgi:divalent metal cation (Fe/Co/Zn/Cd) transporter